MPVYWRVLLLGLGLLLAAPRWATGQAAPLGADTLAPPAPHPDTAATVRRLFAAQRRGIKTQLLTTGASVLLLNYGLAYSTQETTLQRVATGLLAAVLGQAVYNLGAAIVRSRRYRPARERAVLAAFAQGRPLPRRIRKKLVANYFKPKATKP